MIDAAATRSRPSGAAPRLNILIFHRVHGVVDPLFPSEPTAASFRQQMRWIRRWMRVLELEDAVRRLNEGSLPARAVCVTFDDGYEDNVKVAAPILSEEGVPATFFIATGFLNDGVMWNDRVIEAVRHTSRQSVLLPVSGYEWSLKTISDRQAAIEGILTEIKHLRTDDRENAVCAIERTLGAARPSRLMMSRDGVRQLAAERFGIGAHSVSHPILASLADPDASAEILTSKSALEEMLQRSVRAFAYPNGKPGRDYSAAHVRMVREAGFSCAVSTAVGAAGHGFDVYQLPRFTPWDRGSTRYLARLFVNSLRSRVNVAVD